MKQTTDEPETALEPEVPSNYGFTWRGFTARQKDLIGSPAAGMNMIGADQCPTCQSRMRVAVLLYRPLLVVFCDPCKTVNYAFRLERGEDA